MAPISESGRLVNAGDEFELEASWSIGQSEPFSMPESVPPPDPPDESVEG